MAMGLCVDNRVKALLVCMLIGGIGGVIIDVDHIPIQFEWVEARGRPLHIPAFVVAIILVGYHLSRIGRLLAKVRVLGVSENDKG